MFKMIGLAFRCRRLWHETWWPAQAIRVTAARTLRTNGCLP